MSCRSWLQHFLKNIYLFIYFCSWYYFYNLRLQVLMKHPVHASLPLITCCWVNWIIKNLIKLRFGSQSPNQFKFCSLGISTTDQMRKGWCLKPEFWLVSSVMHWNGKVWSGLSIWSLNPLVPLYRVGLLFFCLSILYYRFQCNPLSKAIFQQAFFPFGLLSSSLPVCNTRFAIDLLESYAHTELTVLMWP